MFQEFPRYRYRSELFGSPPVNTFHLLLHPLFLFSMCMLVAILLARKTGLFLPDLFYGRLQQVKCFIRVLPGQQTQGGKKIPAVNKKTGRNRFQTLRCGGIKKGARKDRPGLQSVDEDPTGTDYVLDSCKILPGLYVRNPVRGWDLFNRPGMPGDRGLYCQTG